MDRRLFGRTGLGLLGAFFATSAKAVEDKTHRVVFQIDTEDRRSQELALGNARNYAKHYKAAGKPFLMEIVVFGPGFSMVRGDISMMKGDLESMQSDLGKALTISACHNTRAAIADSMGKQPEDIQLVPGVGDTPSGVVRLAELQEQGWAYVRP